MENSEAQITLLWHGRDWEAFSLMLQRGFLLDGLVGVSIGSVLCDQFGVSRDYLDNRVSTLFLDDQPVDDVDKTTVKAGSTLALSAAMPGLVGAAMRKGGLIASFRDSITYRGGQEGSDTPKQGRFTLKLYNMVVRELGPHFLQKGIVVSTDDLKSFFESRSELFWQNCGRIEIQGQEVSPADLIRGRCLAPGGLVRLKIQGEP